MRALLISDDTRAETARLAAYAKAHPVALSTLQGIADGTLPSLGDDPQFACVIPMGFHCIYNHEHQKNGFFRHLSVSVIDGTGPSVDAVSEIAKLFGFREGIVGADSTWTEDIGGGRLAVNLIQLIDPAQET